MCQTLTRDDLIDISSKYPSIYNSIYGNMHQYNDENMLQKTYFVHNIPFLRGLDI